jgi:hypothetical protein
MNRWVVLTLHRWIFEKTDNLSYKFIFVFARRAKHDEAIS